jgi:hypothetical protein
VDALSAGGLSGSSEPLMRRTVTLDCRLVSQQRCGNVSQRSDSAVHWQALRAGYSETQDDMCPQSCVLVQDPCVCRRTEMEEVRIQHANPIKWTHLCCSHAKHLCWSLQGNLMWLRCIGEETIYIRC